MGRNNHQTWSRGKRRVDGKSLTSRRTRSATSNGAPPTMTGASSPSVNLSCSQPRPAMPGCWTLPISSPQGWPVMGILEPIHIEENDTTFAIGWKGCYRIEGPAFIYVDYDTGRAFNHPWLPDASGSNRPILKFQICLASV